jgi:integrase
MTRKWNKVIAEAGLPADSVPYSLRHSSIVRGLRASLPVRLVAALHDTSIAMIEAHYTHHVTDSMADLAALALIPMTSDR